MSYNIQSIKVVKVLAQGEDYPIFIRLLPSKSEQLLDKVWAETDEGFTTEPILNPPYSEVLQLLFPHEVTAKFYPDKHHVRIWAEERGMKYVVIEFMIQVNPAFPFDSTTVNKGYTYKGTAEEYTVANEEVETVTDDVKQARLSSLAQWGSITYIVENYEDLPTSNKVQLGDIGVVTSSEPKQYFICTAVNPVVWTRFGVDEFKGDAPALVPRSTENTQNLYLKGDGSWSKVDSTSMDSHNIILIDEDFISIDCQPEF